MKCEHTTYFSSNVLQARVIYICITAPQLNNKVSRWKGKFSHSAESAVQVDKKNESHCSCSTTINCIRFHRLEISLSLQRVYSTRQFNYRVQTTQFFVENRTRGKDKTKNECTLLRRWRDVEGWRVLL